MELTPEERKRIYEEELEKRAKQRIEDLTEGEREKIFQEESQTKTVYLDSNMVQKPPLVLKGWKYWIPVLIYFLFFIIVLSPFVGLIVGLILIFIINLVLEIFKPALIFPMIYFKCPYCANDMSLRFDHMAHKKSDYYDKNLHDTGKCPNCNREMNINYKYIGR